jgi:hypothetical protein
MTNSFKKDNGVHKMKSVNNISEAFENCMKQARSVLPTSRKNRTLVTLAATAGMRQHA